MNKAYKFRAYPTKEQASLINKTIGCSRYVFNYFLNLWDESFKKTGKGLSYGKCSAELTKLKSETDWLKEPDKFALQNSLRNLADSYSRFFKKQNDKPRFKSKKNNVQSYQTNFTNGNIVVAGNRIKLPKLGLVKFAKSREVEGRILNVTIRKNPSGKYFISIVVETEVEPLPKVDTSIGIDLGIKNFATLSNGESIRNPKYYRKYEDKLAKLQRSLSRKKTGSSNRNKARIKVARMHEKITNCRTDFLHKLSTRLIRENQTIASETLNVKGMLANHKLAKSISDASWSEINRQLKYKSVWYGRNIKQVDTFFPSSKLCSVCGCKHEKMDLSVREWRCENCGTLHDRDENAANNILQHAI